MSDVRSIKAQLGLLVGDLDPDAVPVCDALVLWSEFDEVERFAASAKTLLARRVEAAGAWRHEGYRSVAEQLAARSGTSVSSARAQLETSQRIADQPKTAQSLRAGELSTRKAELVASAVEVAPDAADQLLELAKTAPVAKLREGCVRVKTAVAGDEMYDRARRERSARHYTDDDNVWHFHARGTVDDGARFVKVFEPIVDRLFKAAYREGRREPTETYAFDAFIDMAHRATGEGAGETPKKSKAPQLLGLVRVDHAALVRGAVEDDEVCEIAGLGPIPATRARELLGDAVVKLVITKGVDVANVTHLGRGPTVAQRIAMWWQVPQCTEIDCTRVQRIQFDHREEWRTTHHTRLDEGDGLCTHHHDLKTLLDWSLVEGTGKRPMVPPDDPRHPEEQTEVSPRGGGLDP